MKGGVKVYRGAPAAARKYVEVGRCRADDYYLAEGTGVAERLAVSRDGVVRELAALSGGGYEAWVAGRDPATGVPRGRVRDDARGVRFVEVVVNGPKSWSLAAELHPDIAAAYAAAQEDAARQILGWVGQHGTTRVGPRGGQVAVPVEQVEAAVVRHYTSRAGDPHRHLHVQVNARVFAAGTWRGLDTVAFRDAIGAVNGIGHAAIVCDPDFRAALARHGFTLDPDGEVTALAPFVGAFSKRAAQIGGLLDRYEAQWRAAHPGEEPGPVLRRSWDTRAWAQDRPDKVVPRDGRELRAAWLRELDELGYRHPDRAVPLDPVRPGSLDRDAAAAEVIARLGAGRSAWNTADVRGQVELLLARTGLVTEASVRAELAEDLTARALGICVSLTGSAVPEHVRALTSPCVLDVEADLVARLAARGTQPPAAAVHRQIVVDERVDEALDEVLDEGQRAAVTVLTSTAPLVVVEGAAGAGKTTMLAATRTALQAQDQRLIVVTPTLKAAQAASVQVGASAGSAAWLVWQHGYRWDDTGAWTRVAQEPIPFARLRPGDVLLVDEAGMCDQDTARALLTIADECGARVALVGDRRQLPAVGRGGVLDLAHRFARPDARIDLDTVHRFVRAVNGQVVPDPQYGELSIAMRTGEDPGAVFDQLLARGQIQLHASDAERLQSIAALVAAQRHDGGLPLVVVATREGAAALSTGVRDQLILLGVVDDARVAVTAGGERLGAGDVVVTRRNDPHLQVANRDSWTVRRVHRDGSMTVTDARGGSRDLPAGYVEVFVELGYAVTGYGAQGDTTDTAHLLVDEHTSAAGVYVGMTRGRYANTAHLVADNLDDAREQWINAAGRDRADLGPTAAGRAAARAAAGYAPIRPLSAVLADLHACWGEQDERQQELDQAVRLRERLHRAVAVCAERDRVLPPLEAGYQQARTTARDTRAAAERCRTGIEQDTAAACDRLLTAWDAQREHARQAAETIRRGPGRLGVHLVAVNRATETLAAWSMRWQPVLPDMPTDTAGIASYATWPHERQRILTAFDRHARPHAEHAHPEHAALQQAADHAERDRQDAWRTLTDARGRFDDQLYRTGAISSRDPRQHLGDIEQLITTQQARLDALSGRLQRLAHEPAVTSRLDPNGWLAGQHAAWKNHRDDQQHADQQRQRAAAQQRAAERQLQPTWHPTPAIHRGPSLGR
jgi:hypothetical protein